MQLLPPTYNVGVAKCSSKLSALVTNLVRPTYLYVKLKDLSVIRDHHNFEFMA